MTLTNDGRIEVTGNTPAIEVWGETATIVNHGQILAPGLAIDLGGFWGTLSHVTNAGEITGGLLGSKQADEVINTGTMGDVWLRAGNDLVTNGGTMGEVWLGAGNDQLTGLRQGRVHAGIGDDVLIGGKAADQLYGDEGRDTMTGGGGADQLFGGGEADVLSGGAGADQLYGGQSRDTLTGGAGDDRLFGGDGADRLSGGAGNDWLSGGAGADTLWGGAGADVFVLSPLGKGLDWIRDFERGTDHIRLQDGLTWIGSDDFSGQGGEVRWNSQYEGMMADLDGDGIWDWSAKLERVYEFDLQDFV